ncbi:hypothetical protein BH10PSE11_BH10PSE11_27620 [soil metagenome]
MAKKRRERIYLVPRISGMVMGFVLLLIFALGFAFPNVRDLSQPLGIALLVAGVVILIQTNENLGQVEITNCHSFPTAAGEPALLELTLRSGAKSERTGLQVRPALRWRTAWKLREPAQATLAVLEPNHAAVVRLPIPTTRRGRYAMPDLWVCSILPVGLCFAWKVFPSHGEYFVYPRPRGVPLNRAAGQGRQAGEGPSGGNEDVSGHRPYEAGDPLSRLDWRVFARTGKPVVRTLEDGSGGEVILRWDDTRFLVDVEERLEQLSFWIDECIREERPFRLEFHSAHSELSSRNIAACREALAIYDGGEQ